MLDPRSEVGGWGGGLLEAARKLLSAVVYNLIRGVVGVVELGMNGGGAEGPCALPAWRAFCILGHARSGVSGSSFCWVQGFC